MPATSHLQHALALAGLGWPIIPLCHPAHAGDHPPEHADGCTRPGKQPPFKWKRYQTTLPTEAEQRAWWGRNPLYNLALIFGRLSGVVGIDIDTADGERKWADFAAGDAPPTWEFGTGRGGRRILYRWAHQQEPRGRPFPDLGGVLEFLGEGRYSVVPPSLHVSGVRYGWTAGGPGSGMPIADAPRVLVDAVLKTSRFNSRPGGGVGEGPTTPSPARQIKRAVAWAANTPGAVEGSGGRTTTFILACALVHGFSLTVEEALTIMMGPWNAKCDPPWPEWQMRERVQSAMDTGSFGPIEERPMPARASKTRAKPASKPAKASAVNPSRADHPAPIAGDQGERVASVGGVATPPMNPPNAGDSGMLPPAGAVAGEGRDGEQSAAGRTASKYRRDLSSAPREGGSGRVAGADHAGSDGTSEGGSGASVWGVATPPTEPPEPDEPPAGGPGASSADKGTKKGKGKVKRKASKRKAVEASAPGRKRAGRAAGAGRASSADAVAGPADATGAVGYTDHSAPPPPVSVPPRKGGKPAVAGDQGGAKRPAARRRRKHSQDTSPAPRAEASRPAAPARRAASADASPAGPRPLEAVGYTDHAAPTRPAGSPPKRGGKPAIAGDQGERESVRFVDLDQEPLPGMLASELVHEEVSFLIDRLFPFGMLSLVTGEGGSGKGTFLGRLMREAGKSVLVVAKEEPLKNVLGPRLSAAGVDPRNLLLLNDRPYSMPGDKEAIAQVVSRFRARAVFFDPVTSFMRDGDCEDNNSQVRNLLEAFAWIGETTGAAIVGVLHPGKAAGNHLRGASNWRNVPRCVVRLTQDEGPGRRRVLEVIKYNLGEWPSPRFFDLVARDGSSAAFVFQDEIDPRLAELIKEVPEGRKRRKVEQAKDLIRQLLKDGKKEAGWCLAKGKRLGLCDTTMGDAARVLGVAVKKSGWGEGAAWHWSLSAEPAEASKCSEESL